MAHVDEEPHLYVGFLRAINLGAKRRFPVADVRRVVDGVGGTEVRTYLNTGNVALLHPETDPERMRAMLESAFEDDRGFEVPTVLFSGAELLQVAREIAEVRAGAGDVVSHYVYLLRDPAPADALARWAEVCADGVRPEGERSVVRGRAVHLLAEGAFHAARLPNSRHLAALGMGTARSHKVLTTLAERWGA